jgi:hypothetical protein
MPWLSDERQERLSGLNKWVGCIEGEGRDIATYRREAAGLQPTWSSSAWCQTECHLFQEAEMKAEYF